MSGTGSTENLLACLVDRDKKANVCGVCGAVLPHRFYTYSLPGDDPKTHPDPAQIHRILCVEAGHEDDFVPCGKVPLWVLSPTERASVFNWSAHRRAEQAAYRAAVESAGGEEAYWAAIEAAGQSLTAQRT